VFSTLQPETTNLNGSILSPLGLLQATADDCKLKKQIYTHSEGRGSVAANGAAHSEGPEFDSISETLTRFIRSSREIPR